MTYSHLTQGERYQIAALFNASHSKADIARCLDRSPSTISREIKRNMSQRGYRPAYAHKCSTLRSKNSRNGTQIGSSTWSLVRDQLRQTWSPEQIWAAGKSTTGVRVSHESIYQYIYADKRNGGNLHLALRCQKKRKKRYGLVDRRGAIANAVSIDLRPDIVNQKARFGDWEVDLVIGKNHQFALVTLNERVSRYSLFALVPNKTAEVVSKMIITLLTPFAAAVHTITSDNGKEFAYHDKVAKALNAQCFFAHPYSSWERGANENMNGLIREFFPKGMTFDSITHTDIEKAMNLLNHRPRKCLNYQTPHQVFFSHIQSLSH